MIGTNDALCIRAVETTGQLLGKGRHTSAALLESRYHESYLTGLMISLDSIFENLR